MAIINTTKSPNNNIFRFFKSFIDPFGRRYFDDSMYVAVLANLNITGGYGTEDMSGKSFGNSWKKRKLL